MDKIIKQDDAIIKALDLKTLSRVICQTDKGTLCLQIRKWESKYYLVLDAVPLDAELNKELMDLLFPAKVLNVPQVNKEPTHLLHNLGKDGKTELTKAEDIPKLIKKLGRAAKNK